MPSYTKGKGERLMKKKPPENPFRRDDGSAPVGDHIHDWAFWKTIEIPEVVGGVLRNVKYDVWKCTVRGCGQTQKVAK